MPKMKTKKAAAKRFKVTGSGQLKRKQAYRQHIAHGKTTKQRRHLRKATMVHPTDQSRIQELFQG
ncbi:MAG: 50S ribosomal protein L35 [Bacilli bacterium]|jgi:large subunit ribosomal protein L35